MAQKRGARPLAHEAREDGLAGGEGVPRHLRVEHALEEDRQRADPEQGRAVGGGDGRAEQPVARAQRDPEQDRARPDDPDQVDGRVGGRVRQVALPPRGQIAHARARLRRQIQRASHAAGTLSQSQPDGAAAARSIASITVPPAAAAQSRSRREPVGGAARAPAWPPGGRRPPRSLSSSTSTTRPSRVGVKAWRISSRPAVSIASASGHRQGAGAPGPARARRQSRASTAYSTTWPVFRRSQWAPAICSRVAHGQERAQPGLDERRRGAAVIAGAREPRDQHRPRERRQESERRRHDV